MLDKGHNALSISRQSAKDPQYLHRVKTKTAETQRARAIGRALLAWYAQHRRDLPWRRRTGSGPAARVDPYAVWVSEMMLQQTQVATVVPYFARWMERFPDVATLASAEESDVLHAWQGLGYYSRARNLRRAAQTIVQEHGGRVPERVAELRALPGIGPYSAGAIASIAYGQREPLVDGNVIRVLTRLFALRGDPNRAPLKERLWEVARSIIPAQAPGDFNQALMELGATVCSPQNPRCQSCPLSAGCQALEQGLVDRLPELPQRPKATQVHMAAAVATRSGRVLVAKQGPDAARWAGMWLFPNAELHPRELPERAAERALQASAGLTGKVAGLLCVVRHTVTRFRITLDAHRLTEITGTAAPRGVAQVAWKRPAELLALAMPKAHRAIAERLLAR